MTLISFVASTGVVAATSVVVPASTVAGDLIIVAAYGGGPGAPLGTPSSPTGYTQRGLSNATNAQVAVWSKTAVAGDAGSTVVIGLGVYSVCLVYRNVVAINATGTASASDVLSLAGPVMSSAQNNSVAVTFFGAGTWNSTDTLTLPGTVRGTQGSNTYNWFGGCDALVSAGSFSTGTATTTKAQKWAAVGLMLTPNNPAFTGWGVPA